MNTTDTPQRPLDSFESALLTDLRAVVATRAPADPATAAPTTPGTAPTTSGGRRRPVLRWAAVAAAAAVPATALQLAPGRGTSPAYAVTGEPDGDVVVTVTRLEDGSGLQEALRAKGINARVDYVPDAKMCDPTRLTPATLTSERGLMSVAMTPQGTTFTIPRGLLTTTQTLVLEAMVTADPSNTVGLRATIAQGPVGACRLVAADDPGPDAPGARTLTGDGQGPGGQGSGSASSSGSGSPARR